MKQKETNKGKEKEHKYEVCNLMHSLRRLHLMKDNEDLTIRKQSLLMADDEEHPMFNCRCLGGCNGKRMLNHDEKEQIKKEPWKHAMEKGSGATICFCSNCPQGKCDVVLCGDCANKPTVMSKFDTQGSRKRNATTYNSTAEGGGEKKKGPKKTKKTTGKKKNKER